MKKIKIQFLILLSTFCANSQEIIFDEDGVNNTSGLAIFDNKLYIAGRFSDNIYKINLSAPNEDPIVILEGIDGPADIEISEGVLYVSLNSNNSNLDKIIKFDLNDSNTSPEDIVSIANPNGITIYNNIIYVSSEGNIFTIDLSADNPSPVLFIKDVSYVFGTVGICVLNNHFYATGNGQLEKYDLNSSNPQKEIIIDNFNGEGLTVKDDKIYSAGYSKLFEINTLDEDFSEIAEFDIPTGWDVVTNNGSIFVSNMEGGEVIQFDLSTLGINEAVNKVLNFYPNPSSTTITFDKLYENTGIQIFDSNGRIVQKAILDNKKQLNVEDLQNGLYLIKLNKNQVSKFIKR